jgi:hypothetical protein
MSDSTRVVRMARRTRQVAEEAAVARLALDAQQDLRLMQEAKMGTAAPDVEDEAVPP